MGLFRRRPLEEIERMKAEMASLREALERQAERQPPAPDATGRLDELASKLAALDARVTSVSTELANQLAELGNDLDALDQRPSEAAPDGAVIDELRDGQVRLANEQARYQIAFREDLSRLAEQLRRPS